MHFFAKDGKELVEKLGTLGSGVNYEVIDVFLRELRDVWEKVDQPLPAPATLAARNLGLIQTKDRKTALEEMKALWETKEYVNLRFSDCEAALARLGEGYCQKRRCLLCSLELECSGPKNLGEV